MSRLIFKEVKKKLNLCVYDNTGGCYLSVAHKMSDYFNVFYYSGNPSPFPRMSVDMIGTGYDNITKVSEFWGENLDNMDIIVMPDIYCNDEGYRLRKMGKMVWGGTQAEQLETNRQLFKEELKSVGLAIAPTNYIKGVSALGKYLKDKKDNWVKLSYYRGEKESFKNKGWNQTEVLIDEMNYQMGPLADSMEFTVEDNVDAIAEIGVDGWTVGGKYSNNMIWGLEVKDVAYLGKASTFSDIPDQLKQVTQKFEPILQKYGHTGFYSTEVRAGKDQKTYYTDPCMRVGSPSGNVYFDLTSNWDEIIPKGSKGEIVEPKFKAKYGVELILKSAYCNNNYLPLTIPKEFRKFVNLKGSFKLGDREYIIPFIQAGITDMEAFGSVSVIGDDVDSLMKQALEIADSIDCPGLTYDSDGLKKGKMELNNLYNNIGVQF